MKRLFPVALLLFMDYTDFMNKNLIVVAIICLVIGAAAGYYFGYDIGWERAVDSNLTLMLASG